MRLACGGPMLEEVGGGWGSLRSGECAERAAARVSRARGVRVVSAHVWGTPLWACGNSHCCASSSLRTVSFPVWKLKEEKGRE